MLFAEVIRLSILCKAMTELAALLDSLAPASSDFRLHVSVKSIMLVADGEVSGQKVLGFVLP